MQSDFASVFIVTHIILFIQCFQIFKDVIGCFGWANQECSGDVMFLLEMTAHSYTSIGLSAPSGSTEHE